MGLPIVSPGRDPQQVRDTTDEILRRSEFAPREGWLGAVQNFLDDPFYYLVTAVNELFSAFVGRAGAVSQLLAWALAAFVVTLVVILVTRLVRNTSVNDAVPDDAIVPVDQSRSDLLAEAERLEAEGEWRRAIRARHAALVATLSEDGVLRRRPGTTAREYAQQLAVSAPNARQSFDAATSLFEWVWYGATSPGPQQAQQFRGLVDDVRRAVRK